MELEQIIDYLTNLLSEAEEVNVDELILGPYDDPELTRSLPYNSEYQKMVHIHRRADMLTDHVFGIGSRYSLTTVGYHDIENFRSILKTAIEDLTLFGIPYGTSSSSAGSNTAAPRKPQAAPAKPSASADSRKIFLVHGHDDALRHDVARALTALQLDPIILNEQANRGQTIFNKLIDYSDVSFAVVLLTPDDIGHRQGHPSEARPRARQNVVLELGYYLGILGPEKVVALHKSDDSGAALELPSDIQGIVYISVEEDWKGRLVRELKTADISVDANRLY